MLWVAGRARLGWEAGWRGGPWGTPQVSACSEFKQHLCYDIQVESSRTVVLRVEAVGEEGEK